MYICNVFFFFERNTSAMVNLVQQQGAGVNGGAGIIILKKHEVVL